MDAAPSTWGKRSWRSRTVAITDGGDRRLRRPRTAAIADCGDLRVARLAVFARPCLVFANLVSDIFFSSGLVLQLETASSDRARFFRSGPFLQIRFVQTDVSSFT